MKWLILLLGCVWMTIIDIGEAWSSSIQRRRMILDLLLTQSVMIPSIISAKEMDENDNSSIQTMCQNGAIVPGALTAISNKQMKSTNILHHFHFIHF